jgi:hypothetical protein
MILNEDAVTLADVDVVGPAELRTVLTAATRAPSVHNTQPWRFRVTATGVELHADHRRQLATIDPEGRELTISCGAALLNMRVAAAALGRLLHVEALPDAAEPLHLATIRFGRREPAALPDAALAEAIERRHSHRRGFGPGRIPAVVIAALHHEAEREGARLIHLDAHQQRAAARLTRVADAFFASDPAYRRELRCWVSSLSNAADGVSATAFGTQPARSGGPPLRDFTVAMPWLDRAPELFAEEDWFVVVTDDDDRLGWLAAGQAVERVLLHATLAGLGASFMTQALEASVIRGQLAVCVAAQGAPQVLLRIGPARPTAAAGRLPLDEVVTLGATDAVLAGI